MNDTRVALVKAANALVNNPESDEAAAAVIDAVLLLPTDDPAAKCSKTLAGPTILGTVDPYYWNSAVAIASGIETFTIAEAE